MARAFFLHGSNTALLVLCAAILGASVCGFLVLSPWFVLLGAALFYVSEYGTHRFLFHAQPSRWEWLRRKQHRLHYDHHLEPSRLDLLFLPLWYVLPNLAVTTLLAFAILHDAGWVASLVLGAMLALLQYEWVHLAAHMSYRPRTRAGAWMKKYHLWHHFKNERLWFGVSNPLLDVLHGTYRDPDDASRSASTRVLYPER